MNRAELSDYRAYIKGDYWRARKQLYYEKHARECAVCFSKYVDLHHLFYDQLGQETDSDLIPLCRMHHDSFHRQFGTSKNMRAYIAGFIAAERRKMIESINSKKIQPQTKVKSAEIEFPVFFEKIASRLQNIFNSFRS